MAKRNNEQEHQKRRVQTLALFLIPVPLAAQSFHAGFLTLE